MRPRAKDAWSHRGRQRQEGLSPSAFGGRPPCPDSGLQSHERTRTCCFRPRLAGLVTAAQGNAYLKRVSLSCGRFAPQGTARDVWGHLCHHSWGCYWHTVAREAATYPTMRRTAPHKEASSPKCQQRPSAPGCTHPVTGGYKCQGDKLSSPNHQGPSQV